MGEFKFTERYIQRKISNFLAESTKKYEMNNLYIFKWESDTLIETRSNILYEFEVKVTRSDFFNDFKKVDKHAILEGKAKFIPEYYDVIEKGHWVENAEAYYPSNFKKPHYFYYVVPEGLVDVNAIPTYAGLIYVLPEGVRESKDGMRKCLDGFYVVKSAPKLHEDKYTDEELNLTEKFYYNMQNWKVRYDQENKRRMLTEDEGHRIPYAELYEKYNSMVSQCVTLKTERDDSVQMLKVLSKTMEDDYKILRGYRLKMKEIDPHFDFVKFEDEFLENE